MNRRRRLSRLGRFRIKTLDIYVTRQFLEAYVICFVSFMGLYILIEVFAKLDRFLRQDESFVVALLKYHAAMIPTVYANYLGPILTLAAAMFTMTNMSRRNELTPLKASGVSVYRVMVPIFVLATAFTGFNFYLKDTFLPRNKEPIREALALSRSRPLNPSPYYDRDHGYYIKVQEYSTTRKLAQGVEVSMLHPNGKIQIEIDANQMEWIPSQGGDPEEGAWILHQGSIQRWDDMGNLVVNVAATRFERLKEPFQDREFKTTLRPIDLEASDLEISYLSWRDLKNQYQRQPYHRHLAVKLHHHFAFPLAHIILLFLGLPFVLHVSPKSMFVSLAMSFVICALFYFVSTICMNVANQSDFLSPILAAWLPVMLFGSLGITFFDRLPT